MPLEKETPVPRRSGRRHPGEARIDTRRHRLLTLAAVAALLALSATALADSPPFEYYPGLPQGTVGVRMPTIAQELVLNGVAPSQLSFRMTLDGATVPAVLAPDGSRISYRPPAPLAVGSHTVTVHIAVGQWYADSDWSFQITPGAATSLPSPSPAAAFALAWANSYRALAGLPALSEADALVASAAAHAQFYVTNEARYGPSITTSVHDENPSWPGFTGQAPADRASYFGFGYGGVSEDMAFGSGIAASIDGWMDSVYHRFALTDPMARYAGFGLSGSFGSDPNQPATDMEVGDAGAGPSDPTETVAYPAPGQAGVPESFPTGEVPDPLTAFAGATYPAGYPITLQFGSPNTASVSVSSASLTTVAGTAVPFYLLDAATAPPSSAGNAAVSEMGDNVAVIPQQPLQRATLYRVAVAGTVTDLAGTSHPFSRSWTFSTSPYEDPGNLTTMASASGAVILTTSGDSTHAQVFVGGYPVAGLSHVDPNTMTFAIPPGLGATADLYVAQPDGQEESWPAFVGPSGGWTSTAGSPPVQAAGGGITVGGTTLLPVSVLGALGVTQTTLPGTGMTVLESQAGTVVGAYRVEDPVGYLRQLGRGPLQRVVFANPPLTLGGTTYIPMELAAAAGYDGGATATSYAPAGYSGPQQLTLTIGLPQYSADGVSGSWTPALGAPFIAPGGHTMLPLRALSYVFGLSPSEVTWFGPGGLPETGPVQEVDLNTPWGVTIKVTATQILRTGPAGAGSVSIPLEQSGLLVINGRTFVPFRDLGYAFGLDANQISWTNGPTGAVTSVSFSWQTAP